MKEYLLSRYVCASPFADVHFPSTRADLVYSNSDLLARSEKFFSFRLHHSGDKTLELALAVLVLYVPTPVSLTTAQQGAG